MLHSDYMAPASQPVRVTHDMIAQRLGRHRTQVTKFLSGARQPPLSDAIVIFEMTGKRLGELADKTDEQAEALVRILEPSVSAAWPAT